MEHAESENLGKQIYTSSSHLEDFNSNFDGLSIKTGLSLDISNGNDNTKSTVFKDFILDLHESNAEPAGLSDIGSEDTSAQLHQQGIDKAQMAISSIEVDQMNNFISKPLLDSSLNSASQHCLSSISSTARSEKNININFTFDQFLQTLEDLQDQTNIDEETSLQYDKKTETVKNNFKNTTLLSKSSLSSELSLSKSNCSTLSELRLNDIFGSADNKDDIKEYDGPTTSNNYISFPYGFQQRNTYEHSKKLTDLVDVTYNPRTRQFIFLDTRGITTWDKDGIAHAIHRSLNFPKYQNKLLRNIVYARKYNVYFCLAKDFSLKVLNHHFDETCQVASDLSSVLFLLFNPARDELITGGVRGTKIWEYKQIIDRVWTEIKPMANYSLFLKRELKSVGGSWVKKVELDQILQHLYCCSDTDIYCYDMEGKLLFKLNNAHKSQINGCKYSPTAKLLVTCANDCDVKVWSMNGGLVHTFRGHSRAVTNLLLHPEDSSLVLSASLDGSIKMWSLDIMELMYSIVISSNGIKWMGLTGEKYLWTATCHDVSVWHLNQTVHFLALARCKTTSLQIAHAAGKTSRIVAIGEDSSVRLVSIKDKRNLSTVLPPPCISPLQQIQSVTYNREYSVVFVLVDPSEVWVYTMRTDPACRIAVWDVKHMQDRWYRIQSASSSGTKSPESPIQRQPSRGPTSQLGLPNQRASLSGKTHVASLCSALATVNTHIMYWTDEGFVCPLTDNFLLLGLQDGRILFLDPLKQGHRYCELQATRDAILEMRFDGAHSNLIVKSHLREEDLFQFWSLPGLELMHEVLVTPDVTSYARLGLSFYTGHTDGSLTVFTLEQVDTSKNRCHQGGYAVESCIMTANKRKEHLAPVIAVDSCPILGIIATSSSDGAVKIWDEQKTLMSEIAVDDTLTTSAFLNNRGDLIIGYKNHLFVIDHTKVLSSSTRQQAVDNNYETESEIYEDPAVRFERAAANPELISIDNYLVPFDLDFSESFLGGQISPTDSEHSSEQADNEDDGSSEFSMATSEVYVSEVSTPRLSVVDFLLSVGEPIKGEIKEKTSGLPLNKSKISQVVKWSEEQCGLTFQMPRLGVSPGPSPTVTPSSTPADMSESEQDIEEVGSGVEAEEYEEQQFQAIQAAQVTIPQDIREKPKAIISKVQDYYVPEHSKEESRFAISRLKIDPKTLMATKTIQDEFKKNVVKETTPQQSSLAKVRVKIQPVKKKGHRGPRVRVGEKAPLVYAAKSDKKVLDADEVKPSVVSMKPKSEEPVPQMSTVSASALKDRIQTKSKPEAKLSTTKLDMKPLPSLPEVSNAVKSSAPTFKPTKKILKKGSHKRQSIFSSFTKSKGAIKMEDEQDDEPEEEVENVEECPADGIATEPLNTANIGVEDTATPTQDMEYLDRSLGNDREPSRPESTQDINAGESSSIYKTVTHAAIINKYDTYRAPSSFIQGDSIVDFGEGDDIDMRIGSRTSHRSENDALDESQSYMRAVLAISAASSVSSTCSPSHLKRDTPEERDFHPLEEIDLDILEQPNMEVMLKRYGRADPICSMPYICTDSPFMRSVSQATRSVASSQNGERNIRGSVPSDIDTELMLQGRISRSEGDVMASEVGLPVSPEMLGRLARPNTAQGRRPHTAGSEMHVAFQNKEFDYMEVDNIPKFMSFPVTLSDISKFYKNDGLQFKENWQERMIERNHLLRIQKQQRVHSASSRRHLLDLRQRQRRKALLGHHQCTDDLNCMQGRTSSVPMIPSGSSPDTKQMERAKSAPLIGSYASSTKPRRQAYSAHHKELHDFRPDKPYRLRLNQQLPKPKLNNSEIFERFGNGCIASGGPMLLRRTQATRSIPSNNSRFVLVTHDHPEPVNPVPSPLERQLLKARFPKTRRHLLSQQGTVFHREPLPLM